MTESTLGTHEADDAKLLNMVRAGDTEAFGMLRERHWEAARRLARELVTTPAEADEVVAETFARALTAIHRGGGPSNAFRPYMLTALRRVCDERHRSPDYQVMPPGGQPNDPGEPFVDPAVAGLESSLIARAFQSLPERWSAVLWHTEIEQASPAEVSALFGLTRSGVAALRQRATDGLRQSYLQMHIARITRPECRPVAERLGAFIRESLSVREATLVAEHLSDCDECRAVRTELADVRSALRRVVAPLVLGTAATSYLTAAGAGGPGGPARIASGLAGAASAGPPPNGGFAGSTRQAGYGLAGDAFAASGGNGADPRRPSAEPARPSVGPTRPSVEPGRPSVEPGRHSAGPGGHPRGHAAAKPSPLGEIRLPPRLPAPARLRAPARLPAPARLRAPARLGLPAGLSLARRFNPGAALGRLHQASRRTSRRTRWVAASAAAGSAAVVAAIALALSASGSNVALERGTPSATVPAAAAQTSAASPTASPTPSPTPSPTHTKTAAPSPVAPPVVLAVTSSLSAMRPYWNVEQLSFQVANTGTADSGRLSVWIDLPQGTSLITQGPGGGFGQGGGGQGGGGRGGESGWTCQAEDGGASCQHDGIDAGSRTRETVSISLTGPGACGESVDVTVTSGSAKSGSSADIAC